MKNMETTCKIRQLRKVYDLNSDEELNGYFVMEYHTNDRDHDN